MSKYRAMGAKQRDNIYEGKYECALRSGAAAFSFQKTCYPQASVLFADDNSVFQKLIEKSMCVLCGDLVADLKMPGKIRSSSVDVGAV